MPVNKSFPLFFRHIFYIFYYFLFAISYSLLLIFSPQRIDVALIQYIFSLKYFEKCFSVIGKKVNGIFKQSFPYFFLFSLLFLFFAHILLKICPIGSHFTFSFTFYCTYIYIIPCLHDFRRKNRVSNNIQLTIKCCSFECSNNAQDVKKNGSKCQGLIAGQFRVE